MRIPSQITNVHRSSRHCFWNVRRSIPPVGLVLLFLLGLWTGSAHAMYDPTTYNYQNPTFVNDNYTDAQKATQRTNGASIMQALVNAANSGQASYTIPPGTYRVTAKTWNLTGISNFKINCPNVNIWVEFTGIDPNANGLPYSWLSLGNCTNVQILGGNTNFDSESLQFIQATVTGWDATAGTIDLQIMAGYDAAGFTAQQGYMSWIFSQAGVCKLRPSYSSFINLDANDITKKRITVGTGFFTDGESAAMQTGDIFFTRHAVAWYSSVVYCDSSSVNLEIDGISSWYGPMWVMDGCSGSFVTKNCSNYRRSGTNRIAASAEPTLYNSAKTFVWDSCTSGGPGGDDGIDIIGLYSVLPAVTDPQHVILNFLPSIGANLNFFDPVTFAPQGTANVVATTPITDSAQRAALSAGSNQYQTNNGFNYNNASPNASYWTVTLDQPVTATQFAGWDSNDLAASVSVTNSYFADMNAQALYVKGRQITVTGNHIDRGTGSAIYAALSRYWDEGPVPQNVTISNNVINSNPCDYHQPGAAWGWAAASIAVCVEGSLPGVGAINNVVISGNNLTNSLRTAIEVENAANVQITKNTMTNTMTRSPIDTWLMGDLDGILPNAGIYIGASRGVTLSGNTLPSPTTFCPNVAQLGPYNALGTISGNGVTGWTTLPINCANTGSTATYASNTDIWTLNSNGYDIEGSADQFLYVDGTASGDHTLEAKMTGIAYTADWAKAGLMFRDTKAANSKMALVCVTAAHGVEFQCRTTAGASPQDAFANWVPTPTASNPVWLRLSKVGNSYIAYYSTDDATWNQVGSAQTVSFTSTNYLAGLAATSLNSSSTPGSATFASVRYAETWNVASLLPTNVNYWGFSLSAGAYDQPSATWTIQSAGPDINGTADGGCTYVQGTVSGDRTLVAKVTGMTNTSPWAKAGLMLRDTLDPAAAMATVAATPGNGVQFIWRPSSGANTTYVTNGNVPIPTSTNPVWLKLQNTGNACSAYYSLDGVSWAQVGATQTVGFSSSNRLAGLAATGNNGYSVNTATFTNVSLQ